MLKIYKLKKIKKLKIMKRKLFYQAQNLLMKMKKAES